MRSVPQIAVEFVKAHEGCKLTAYADVAGKWTVGVGHCGPDVKPGLIISQTQADAYLMADLATAAERLAAVASRTYLQQLSDNQYAALLSFVFNVGCNPAWTIWKRLNEGDFGGVWAELGRFIYAGDHVIPGLVNRREAEKALFMTPDAPAPAPEPIVVATPQPPPPKSVNTGWVSRLWNRFA